MSDFEHGGMLDHEAANISCSQLTENLHASIVMNQRESDKVDKIEVKTKLGSMHNSVLHNTEETLPKLKIISMYGKRSARIEGSRSHLEHRKLKSGHTVYKKLEKH